MSEVATKLDLGTLRSDQNAERDGVWREFAPGVEFRIARSGTNEDTKVLRELYGPYEVLLRGGDMDPAIDAKLNAQRIAKSILKDWKGVVVDGVETPFSREAAKDLMLGIYDLREWVMQQASNPTNYRQARRAEAGKDSAG